MISTNKRTEEPKGKLCETSFDLKDKEEKRRKRRKKKEKEKLHKFRVCIEH